jgi:hypothetical protein
MFAEGGPVYKVKCLTIFQRAATPTSMSIFDFYDMKPCDINLVMISSVASKCQDFNVGMPVYQPFHKSN